MKKVVLYIAASLDGYIADARGSVDWLGGDGSEPDKHGSYDEFIKTIGTVVFGFTTYNQIVTELAPGRWDYAGMESYVVTHRKMENKPEITFTDEDLPSLVRRLRQGEGKDVWICGGANIINQLMSEDLIDEYWITVMPTILGSGTKLFGERSNELKLKLVSTDSQDGVVDLRYERRK